MNTQTIARHRAEMPKGTSKVLERRTLEHGNERLIPFLQDGMRVLDVGCGTGSITQGIAKQVGPSGRVIGLDVNADLVAVADQHNQSENLKFLCRDLHTYKPTELFDVVVAARTIQWLSEPRAAIELLQAMVAPGGRLFILDYNHEKIRWDPAPPESMRFFYDRFLSWRSDAGMDNRIADGLAGIFKALGSVEVQVEDANEEHTADEADFQEAAGNWATVAETRGKQMVSDEYLDEEERTSAISDYANWIVKEGRSMKMYLKAVTGKVA